MCLAPGVRLGQDEGVETRRAAIVGVLAVALTLVAGAAIAEVAWSDLSVDDAILQAEGDGRHVLVYVTAPWCGPCKKLEREVFDDTYGDGVAEAFVPVKVQWASDAGRDVKERFRVERLPTAVVLDGTGAEVGRIVGYPGKERWEQRLDGMKPAGRALPMAPTLTSPGRR